MIKKETGESENTILIILIITFIVCLSLLLFFISYLDQIYKISEGDRVIQGELGSSAVFINMAGNPIFRSKAILEERLGIYGTILFFIIILLLLISGIYLFIRLKRKIHASIIKEEESKKMDVTISHK